MTRILIINGHPDARPERLCSALADGYARGAIGAGHEIRRIDVGKLSFPLITSTQDFEAGTPPPDILAAQQALRWAEHIVIVHPLWLGAAPALLKGFLEQAFRYGFALPTDRTMKGLLKGRSARVIVTMGMPAPAYRMIFGGFGVRGMERSVLWISGISPIRTTYFGGVETASAAVRRDWIEEVARLGTRAR